MKKELLVLVGIPGSGKSTFAESLKEQGYVVPLNMDGLRRLTPKAAYQSSDTYESAIKAKYRESVIELMTQGVEKIVIDNLNISSRPRTYWKDTCKRWKYEYKEHLLEDSLNVDLCHKRNIRRETSAIVPHKVVEDCAQSFISHWLTTQNWELKEAQIPTVIVDIDGTVANCHGVRSPHDFTQVLQDTPHLDIIHLVKLFKSSGYKVVFLSGRSEECRTETIEWLSRYFEFGLELYMRSKDDTRPDWRIKFELFNQYINGNYRVDYVLDDRDQVVRFWRSMGLRVLQVAPGRF